MLYQKEIQVVFALDTSCISIRYKKYQVLKLK